MDKAGGVPDMTALEDLGEWSMLRNLEIRLLDRSEPHGSPASEKSTFRSNPREVPRRRRCSAASA